jgi:hypothetical protein
MRKQTSIVRPALLLAAAALLALGVLGVACDDGDSENAEATVAPGADPEADPEAEPDPQPDPDPEPGPGVQPAPAGSTQVTVELREWAIEPQPVQVTGPSIYFLATNAGGEPHELVVIRSDEAPDALPVLRGAVPEDEVDFIGEIEEFPAGDQASAVFNLTPGNYVLICNVVETEEDGAVESHYEQGMRTTFIVE